MHIGISVTFFVCWNRLQPPVTLKRNTLVEERSDSRATQNEKSQNNTTKLSFNFTRVVSDVQWDHDAKRLTGKDKSTFTFCPRLDDLHLRELIVC